MLALFRCLVLSTFLRLKILFPFQQVIPEEVVEEFLAACKSGNFDLADKEVNNVISEGYPVSQMISQVSCCSVLPYFFLH